MNAPIQSGLNKMGDGIAPVGSTGVTQAQIDEVESLIREARDARKKNNDPTDKEVVAKYQQAIRKADKYFELSKPPNLLGDEPVFDPDLPPGKQTATTDSPDAAGKCKVRLSEGAFCFPPPNGEISARWLASVKIHEFLHCAQYARPGGMAGGSGPEVEAFNSQLSWAKRLGLTDAMVEWIRKKKKQYYDALNDEEKTKWREKEPWLGYELAPRSESEKQRELKAIFRVLWHSEVQSGTPIRLEDGHVMLTHSDEILGIIADQFADGNLNRLVELNPHLCVSAARLAELLGLANPILPEAHPALIQVPPMASTGKLEICIVREGRAKGGNFRTGSIKGDVK